MKWLCLIGLAVRVALACEPAHLNFEGTAFARRSLQIENDRIYFFRGLAHEVAFTYHSGKGLWCYDYKAAHAQVICLSPAKNLLLRDHRAQAVARVSVAKNVLTAKFLARDGKDLGKRLEF